MYLQQVGTGLVLFLLFNHFFSSPEPKAHEVSL